MNRAGAAAGPAPDVAVPGDRERLFEVWESAVRATHGFLAEPDIDELKPQVRQALAEFAPIHVLRDEDGRAFAFLGVAGPMIEMLFVHAAYRGHGGGRILVRHAIDVLGATRVDVNEQNEQGIGFYEHMGFRRTGRSPLDAAGRPFPILHMALA